MNLIFLDAIGLKLFFKRGASVQHRSEGWCIVIAWSTSLCFLLRYQSLSSVLRACYIIVKQLKCVPYSSNVWFLFYDFLFRIRSFRVDATIFDFWTELKNVSIRSVCAGYYLQISIFTTWSSTNYLKIHADQYLVQLSSISLHGNQTSENTAQNNVSESISPINKKISRSVVLICYIDRFLFRLFRSI